LRSGFRRQALALRSPEWPAVAWHRHELRPYHTGALRAVLKARGELGAHRCCVRSRAPRAADAEEPALDPSRRISFRLTFCLGDRLLIGHVYGMLDLQYRFDDMVDRGREF